MTDAAFLAALAETPDDATLRAVYADFLDDANRHDEADVLRADEAMRRVPVWDDAYWSAKAVRNELRRLCDSTWLRATGCDGSRLQLFFRDGYPAGVRERWRLLRAFAEGWYGVEMPDAGGRPARIAAEERRVGLTFGASLREFVAFVRDAETGGGGPMDGWRYRAASIAEPPVFQIAEKERRILAINQAAVGEADPGVRDFSFSEDGEPPRRVYEEMWDERRCLSEVIALRSLWAVPNSLTFWVRLSSAEKIAAIDSRPMGVVFETPGVFGGRYDDGASDDPHLYFCVHPLRSWDSLPGEVRALCRTGRPQTIRDHSPENLAALAAALGDEVPEWLAEMIRKARRTT